MCTQKWFYYNFGKCKVSRCQVEDRTPKVDQCDQVECDNHQFLNQYVGVEGRCAIHREEFKAGQRATFLVLLETLNALGSNDPGHITLSMKDELMAWLIKFEGKLDADLDYENHIWAVTMLTNRVVTEGTGLQRVEIKNLRNYDDVFRNERRYAYNYSPPAWLFWAEIFGQDFVFKHAGTVSRLAESE